MMVKELFLFRSCRYERATARSTRDEILVVSRRLRATARSMRGRVVKMKCKGDVVMWRCG